MIKAYGFIYITTNICNGKKYIGQRKFSNGWDRYLGSGNSLLSAIKKYGNDSFIRDIVYVAYSKKELDRIEMEFIDNHNAINSRDYYNIAKGGTGGDVYWCNLSNEEIELQKQEKRNNWILNNPNNNRDLIGENNPFFGKTHSEKQREKWSKARKGIKLTDEQKLKQKGKNKGRKHSEESKIKMSEKVKTKRKVICITTGKIYDSTVQASLDTNIYHSNISYCCKGKLKSCGKTEKGEKMIWEYLV